MKRIRRLRQKIGDLITVLMIVAGLTMAISSLAVEDKVSAPAATCLVAAVLPLMSDVQMNAHYPKDA